VRDQRDVYTAFLKVLDVWFELFIEVYIEVYILWVVVLVVWWMDTTVSEDRVATIFRVEVCDEGDVSTALLPPYKGYWRVIWRSYGGEHRNRGFLGCCAVKTSSTRNCGRHSWGDASVLLHVVMKGWGGTRGLRSPAW
jgi:hypothetical protein